MQEYVVGFLFDGDWDNVLLICKNRPDWQKGLLNGIGGKVEKDESPHDAMIREFTEETGITVNFWNLFATLTDIDNYEVNFFVQETSLQTLQNFRSLTDEQVGIYTARDCFETKTADNLRWLLPMAINHLFTGGKISILYRGVY